MTLGATAVVAASPSHSAHQGSRRVVFGHSVRGRPLVAVRLGDPNAKRTALVVGQIHGNEPAGRAVVKELRHLQRPFGGIAVWTVLSVNPDGNRLDTRKNARGVDLNRNFSYRWSGAQPPSSGYYAGPRPFSEPESRAVKRLVKRIRPDVSIWFHQPWGAVLGCRPGDRIQRRFARIARMPVECRGLGLPGTAVSWENHRFGGHAFVVEFHAGSLSTAEVRRAAHASAHVAVKGGR